MKEVFENKDVKETKTTEAEDYKDIKPEGNSNPEESKSFIDDLFSENTVIRREKTPNKESILHIQS